MAGDPLLTLQVFSSPRQEIVEDVEGPLFFGLADSTRFLQKIFAKVKELYKLEGWQLPPLPLPLSKAPELQAENDKTKANYLALSSSSRSYTWEPVYLKSPLLTRERRSGYCYWQSL